MCEVIGLTSDSKPKKAWKPKAKKARAKPDPGPAVRRADRKRRMDERIVMLALDTRLRIVEEQQRAFFSVLSDGKKLAVQNYSEEE